MTLPKIVVINLRRSPSRRVAMTRMLNQLELEFELFEAVDGMHLSRSAVRQAYNPLAAFMRLGRELHPNEIGCSLSHLGVWERMLARGDEVLLVLEDDITLSDTFKILLMTLSDWAPADWAVINFAHHIALPVALMPLGDRVHPGAQTCRFAGTVAGSGAYLIRSRAARALLSHSRPIRMPLDDLLGSEAFTGGPIYGIVPRVTRWNDAEESSIWVDQSRSEFAASSRSGVLGWMRRGFRRAHGALATLAL